MEKFLKEERQGWVLRTGAIPLRKAGLHKGWDWIHSVQEVETHGRCGQGKAADEKQEVWKQGHFAAWINKGLDVPCCRGWWWGGNTATDTNMGWGDAWFMMIPTVAITRLLLGSSWLVWSHSDGSWPTGTWKFKWRHTKMGRADWSCGCGLERGSLTSSWGPAVLPSPFWELSKPCLYSHSWKKMGLEIKINWCGNEMLESMLWASEETHIHIPEWENGSPREEGWNN